MLSDKIKPVCHPIKFSTPQHDLIRYSAVSIAINYMLDNPQKNVQFTTTFSIIVHI